jgi:hypothetical protein
MSKDDGDRAMGVCTNKNAVEFCKQLSDHLVPDNAEDALSDKEAAQLFLGRDDTAAAPVIREGKQRDCDLSIVEQHVFPVLTWCTASKS